MAEEGKLDPVVDVRKKSNVFAKFWADVKEQPLSQTHCWVAFRIIQKKVSRILFNKRCYFETLQAFAGTKYRGQFEANEGRNEWIRKNDDIILFIDEIHTIVGAVEQPDLWMPLTCLSPL
jgi:ATP-dependent Clp protease ATP-binding subunit ClpC